MTTHRFCRERRFRSLKLQKPSPQTDGCPLSDHVNNLWVNMETLSLNQLKNNNSNKKLKTQWAAGNRQVLSHFLARAKGSVPQVGTLGRPVGSKAPGKGLCQLNTWVTRFLYLRALSGTTKMAADSETTKSSRAVELFSTKPSLEKDTYALSSHLKRQQPVSRKWDVWTPAPATRGDPEFEFPPGRRAHFPASCLARSA